MLQAMTLERTPLMVRTEGLKQNTTKKNPEIGINERGFIPKEPKNTAQKKNIRKK